MTKFWKKNVKGTHITKLLKKKPFFFFFCYSIFTLPQYINSKHMSFFDWHFFQKKRTEIYRVLFFFFRRVYWNRKKKSKSKILGDRIHILILVWPISVCLSCVMSIYQPSSQKKKKTKNLFFFSTAAATGNGI